MIFLCWMLGHEPVYIDMRYLIRVCPCGRHAVDAMRGPTPRRWTWIVYRLDALRCRLLREGGWGRLTPDAWPEARRAQIVERHLPWDDPGKEMLLP